VAEISGVLEGASAEGAIVPVAAGGGVGVRLGGGPVSEGRITTGVAVGTTGEMILEPVSR
jgi:hypothetical protein